MDARDRSFEETALLQALFAAGYDLARAEVADVEFGAPEGTGTRIRVTLEWRLPPGQAERVLEDSVRFEANACS